MIRLFRPFARVFELDLRSLALLRISMGAILLADLGVRAADLRVMYSNAGVLSTEQAVDYIGKTGWSLYWYSGSPLYVTILFLIAMTAAICLTLGFRTLLATIVSWVLLVSLHNRLPFVVNGGDVLLRMLLLWSMFLPAGTVWSVDAMHGRGKPEGRTARTGTTVLSVAGMCLVLQLCQVYLFTGLFKMNELWLGFHPWDAILQPNYEIKDLGGVALQRAFAYPSYARPVAQQLLKSP